MIDQYVTNLVFQFSGDGSSSREIEKRLLDIDIKLSHTSIQNILKWKGKRRESIKNGTKFKVLRERRVLTPKVLKKLDSLTSADEVHTIREMENKLEVHRSSVSRGIMKVLNKKKVIKVKVHQLIERDRTGRRTLGSYMSNIWLGKNVDM